MPQMNNATPGCRVGKKRGAFCRCVRIQGELRWVGALNISSAKFSKPAGSRPGWLDSRLSLGLKAKPPANGSVSTLSCPAKVQICFVEPSQITQNNTCSSAVGRGPPPVPFPRCNLPVCLLKTSQEKQPQNAQTLPFMRPQRNERVRPRPHGPPPLLLVAVRLRETEGHG